MTLKPRWVHPLNFREQDKAIMDAAILLARREGSDLTNVIRDALKDVYSRQNCEKILVKNWIHSLVILDYLLSRNC